MIWESYIKSLKEEVDIHFDPIDPEVLEYAKSKGYTIEAFHGSRNKELTKISEMRTSYGIFFSPDPVTSSGYTGSNEGKIYHVLLRAENVIDFTDDMTRYNFFKTYMSSGNVARFIYNDFYGVYREVEDHDIIKDLVKNSSQELMNILKSHYGDKFSNEDGSPIKNASELRDFIEWVADEDEFFEIEDIKKIVDEKYPERDIDVEELMKSYGSQDFYLNYQDDVLKSAENEGYDMVIFDDPATLAGGEATSYVVFDPSNIKLADTDTYDSNGNVIPLNKRFNKNITDIRY